MKPEWQPDYGPVEFLPTWGATIAGARNFLIAYNINILGTKEQAHRLALNLRTQGRGPDQVPVLAIIAGIIVYIFRSQSNGKNIFIQQHSTLLNGLFA